jgi:hypothetical protein
VHIAWLPRSDSASADVAPDKSLKGWHLDRSAQQSAVQRLVTAASFTACIVGNKIIVCACQSSGMHAPFAAQWRLSSLMPAIHALTHQHGVHQQPLSTRNHFVLSTECSVCRAMGRLQPALPPPEPTCPSRIKKNSPGVSIHSPRCAEGCMRRNKISRLKILAAAPSGLCTSSGSASDICLDHVSERHAHFDCMPTTHSLQVLGVTPT